MTPGPRNDDAEALDALAHRLTVSVVRLNRLIRQTDTGGMTPSMSAALASIARHGEPTLGEVAAHEHVSPATMTAIVKKLEAQRLVARVADAADGRVTRVRVTAAGRRRLDENRSRRVRWIRDRLGELAPDERARLTGAIDVLAALTELTEVSEEAHP
jgi:DNA-binding MarR family transcriptional regulator